MSLHANLYDWPIETTGGVLLHIQTQSFVVYYCYRN